MIRAIAVMSLLWGSVAFAGVGDDADDHIYTVPGVIQTASLVTVFQCTNTYPTGYGSLSMTVDVFDTNGQLAGTASQTMLGGASRAISTNTVNGLTVNASAGVPNGTFGSAIIIGSKKLVCTAFVISPDAAPGTMSTLPILAKNKQKGQ